MVPISSTEHMYLGSGIPPIAKALERKVNVALGTDGPASNDSQDMLECLKFAACLQKVGCLDSSVVTAMDVLRMATINGIKALHLEDKLGTIEVGKKADLTIVEAMKPHIVPIHDPAAALVYNANGGDVDTVIINGEIIVSDGEVRTIDEGQVIRKTREIAERIVEEAGK